jgi:hypothetical protein
MSSAVREQIAEQRRSTTFFERGKDFIPETDPAQLSPDLFDRIHFWRIWWDIEQANVFRHNMGDRLMPGGTVTA